MNTKSASLRQTADEPKAKRRTRSQRAISLFAVILLLIPWTAMGARAPTSVRVLVEEGNKLFAASKHAEALAKFEAAYAQYPNAKLQYNLARSYEALGRWADAANAYSIFLEQGGLNARSRQIIRTKAALMNIDQKTALLRFEGALEGLSFILDGVPTNLQKMAVWRVMPGPHRLVIEGEQRARFEDEFALVLGEIRQIDVPKKQDVVGDPNNAPNVFSVTTPRDSTVGNSWSAGNPLSAQSSPDTERSLVEEWWFWTAVGVVAAGAVVGSVALLSSGSESELGSSNARGWESY